LTGKHFTMPWQQSRMLIAAVLCAYFLVACASQMQSRQVIAAINSPKSVVLYGCAPCELRLSHKFALFAERQACGGTAT